MNTAPPPALLDDGQVLEYAIVDDSVQFTGNLNLYAGEKKIGAVPRLAICRHRTTADLLLMHCGEEWEVLAVQAWNSPIGSSVLSVDDVKRRAERYYRGISAKWIALGP